METRPLTARTTPETARDIPEATVARLPVYLRALTTLSEQGTGTCSSEDLAAAAGVNSAKLRKDLSYLGSYGTRGPETAARLGLFSRSQTLRVMSPHGTRAGALPARIRGRIHAWRREP